MRKLRELFLLVILGTPCHFASVNVTKSSFFFSLTTTPPILIDGVEIPRQSDYDRDVYLEYDKAHRQMTLDFQFADTRCEINQWYCDGACVHRRERCLTRGGCHRQYPVPCEKKNRCFSANDDCWHRACRGEECQWISPSPTVGQLSMKQRRFLASCPDEKDRLLPCNTEMNPQMTRGSRRKMVCFYNDEQYCSWTKKCSHISSKCFKNRYNERLQNGPMNGNPLIPHNNINNNRRNNNNPPSIPNNGISYNINNHIGYDHNNNGRPDPYFNNDPRFAPGDPRYPPGGVYPREPSYRDPVNPMWSAAGDNGNPNCPNKWTPCYGMCMDSDYPFKCGDNLCLSVVDMSFYRECDDLCVRNHIACNGECRLGYTPCRTQNQCFRDPEGRCDNRRDCWDGSDESGCFRTFVLWIAIPTLVFLFILIVAVYFTMGWFIRRTLAAK